jgi:hypothetical protein
MNNLKFHKITDKSSIRLTDGSEQVWCEVGCNDNICTLKLFNQNIPVDYRGESNTDMFKQMISCADSREALCCQDALATLIFNGYSESCNWYVGGLDIGDIIGIFSDKMSFCEVSIGTDQLESYLGTISKLNVNRKAFIYLRANKDTLNEYVLNTVLTPNALTEKDVELWIQYSTENTIPLGSLVVDLWYR